MEDYSSLPDHQLVDLFKNGNIDAWFALYTRYLNWIYSFIYKRAPDEADDLVQEFYIIMLDGKKIQKFDNRSSFKTWVRIVLDNWIKDRRKSNKFEGRIEYLEEYNEDDKPYKRNFSKDSFGSDTLAEEVLIKHENLAIIREAIEAIDTEHRIPLKLTWCIELESEEIRYIAQETKRDLNNTITLIEEIYDKYRDVAPLDIKVEERIAILSSYIIDYHYKEAQLGDRINELYAISPLPIEELRKLEEALEETCRLIRKRESQILDLRKKQKAGKFTKRLEARDVAVFLNLEEGNVHQRLTRARNKFRANYEELVRKNSRRRLNASKSF